MASILAELSPQLADGGGLVVRRDMLRPGSAQLVSPLQYQQLVGLHQILYFLRAIITSHAIFNIFSLSYTPPSES
jgi:hypothetical protein